MQLTFNSYCQALDVTSICMQFIKSVQWRRNRKCAVPDDKVKFPAEAVRHCCNLKYLTHKRIRFYRFIRSFVKYICQKKNKQYLLAVKRKCPLAVCKCTSTKYQKIFTSLEDNFTKKCVYIDKSASAYMRANSYIYYGRLKG